MKTSEGIREALQHTNVQAFLRMIRAGESSQDDIAYRMLWGYHPTRNPDRLFSDFSNHPRIFFTLPDGRRTSAAGAYQITATSWDDMRHRRDREYKDFSPATQDFWAVDRIDWRGALDDVLAGNFVEAVRKLQQEWTSLPDAPEGNQTWAQARKIYYEYGGVENENVNLKTITPKPTTTSTQPTPTEAPMAFPLLPVILAGLQTALPLIGQIFAGTDPKKAAMSQAATAVVDTVVKATGAYNEQEALQKVQTDDVARAAAEEAIKAKFFALQSLAKLDQENWQMEEKSRADARAFGVSVFSMEGWRAIGFGVVICILAFTVIGGGGWVLREVMSGEWADQQTKAGIVEMVKAVIILVIGYFFGSSSDSRRKTNMLAGREAGE